MNLMKPYDDMTEFDKYEMYLRYERLLFGWEMSLISALLFFGGAGIGYLAGIH